MSPRMTPSHEDMDIDRDHERVMWLLGAIQHMRSEPWNDGVGDESPDGHSSPAPEEDDSTTLGGKKKVENGPSSARIVRTVHDLSKSGPSSPRDITRLFSDYAAWYAKIEVQLYASCYEHQCTLDGLLEEENNERTTKKPETPRVLLGGRAAAKASPFDDLRDTNDLDLEKRDVARRTQAITDARGELARARSTIEAFKATSKVHAAIIQGFHGYAVQHVLPNVTYALALKANPRDNRTVIDATSLYHLLACVRTFADNQLATTADDIYLWQACWHAWKCPLVAAVMAATGLALASSPLFTSLLS